jgi:hypothetical protein
MPLAGATAEYIMTKTEIQNEALERARASQALTNYPAIFAGFMAKGISESDIRPRENVFTFKCVEGVRAVSQTQSDPPIIGADGQPVWTRPRDLGGR